MPRNAEVIRQWQILREIEARRTGVTIHELARSTRVSTRTIRRDLQALQEAGFSIFDEGEENETKKWRLEGSAFRSVEAGLTVADVATLYLSRAMVEGLSGWPLAEGVRETFAKIEDALNPRMREFLSTLPQVLSAKAGPRSRESSTRMVDITRRLFDATRDRHVVEMRYFSAASNRAKTYTVEPYRLTLAQGGVYLVGWVPQYEAFRTFAAERIEKLSVSVHTFRKTRELPDDLFGSSLGVFSGEPERIVVEFEAKLTPFVRGRIWHESQKLEELDEGRLRLTLHVSNDWALRSWVMGFGAGAHIVEPQHVAEAIVRELEDAVAGYRLRPRKL